MVRSKARKGLTETRLTGGIEGNVGRRGASGRIPGDRANRDAVSEPSLN